MRINIFPIIAVTASLLASCSGDDPKPGVSGELPYITMTAEDAQGDDSSIESRGETLTDTVFTITHDGKDYTIEVETEPLTGSQTYGRADTGLDHNAFRMWCWMRQAIADASGNKPMMLYMDEARAYKLTDDNVWRIVPTKGPFGVPDETIDGYRWPGMNSDLAFLGVYPAFTTDDLLDKPTVTVGPTTSTKVEIGVDFVNEHNYDMALATCSRRGDYYTEAATVTMRFYHLTAAIEVMVQKNLFKGYAFQAVRMTDVKSSGTVSFYPSNIWTQGYYDRIYPNAKLVATGTDTKSWVTARIFNGEVAGYVPEIAPQVERTDNSTDMLNINSDHLLYMVPQTTGANARIQLRITNKDSWADLNERVYKTFDISIANRTFNEGVKYKFRVLSAGSNSYPNPAN